MYECMCRWIASWKEKENLLIHCSKHREQASLDSAVM